MAAAVGLFLGAITMVAAIAAAVYARRAAVATESTVVIAQGAAEGADVALTIAARNADSAAEQVKISEETALRHLRAYIGVSSWGFSQHGDPSDKGPWNLQLSWKNFGSTPATNVTLTINYVMLCGEMPVDFDFPDGVLTKKGGIMPGNLLYTHSDPTKDEDVQKVLRGEQRLYMWAVIEYSDVFPQTPRRRTEFACEVEMERYQSQNLIRIARLNRFGDIDTTCAKVA